MPVTDDVTTTSEPYYKAQCISDGVSASKVRDRDQDQVLTIRDQDRDQALKDQDYPLQDRELKNPRSKPHILTKIHKIQ